MFQKSFWLFLLYFPHHSFSASFTISSFSFLSQNMNVPQVFGPWFLLPLLFFFISNLLKSFCLNYLSVSYFQKSVVSLIIITVYCITLLLIILPAGKHHHLFSKAWAYYFSNSTLNNVHLSPSSCLPSLPCLGFYATQNEQHLKVKCQF